MLGNLDNFKYLDNLSFWIIWFINNIFRICGYLETKYNILDI